MAKTYTGIDIGSSQVKLAVCGGNGEIRQLAAVPVPDQLVHEGRVTSREAMGELLRTAVREHKIKNRTCAVILPAALAFTRRLTVPLMSVEQLKLNLPYEFRDFITQEKDKYVYDYAVAGTVLDQTGRGALDLAAAACLKSTLSDYASMLRRAGFRMAVAAPVEFAYGTLLRMRVQAKPETQKNECCVIDLGHAATRVHIFKKNHLEVTRVIEYGCSLLDSVIADELHVDEHIARTYKEMNHNDVQSLEICRTVYHNIAIEIMRAINFYGFNNPESRLTDAYYCGGGARIPPLVEDVAATIGLTLHSVEELLPANPANRQEPLLHAAAVGIARQGV